jgi:plastocyanin
MAQDAIVEDPVTTPPPPSGGRWLILIPIVVALVGTLVIYVIAASITPDPASKLFGKSGAGTFPLKSDLASGVLALAALQLYTALWIFGKINRRWTRPKRLGTVHRASGIAAIVLSLPIAYNCLVAYGFEHFDRRVFVHALAGCVFYGVFAAKLVIVRSKRLPGWMLPAAGGTLVAIIFVLWYSAALWYYNGFDSPGLSPKVKAVPAANATGYGPATGGGGGPATTKVVGGAVQVSYKNVLIVPQAITVKAGQKIKWTNFDKGIPHNVISQGSTPDPIKSANFVGGQSFTFTPTKPGVIHYICTIHPTQMIGTITVIK